MPVFDRFWPVYAIASIYRPRQLSGAKLPLRLARPAAVAQQAASGQPPPKPSRRAWQGWPAIPHLGYAQTNRFPLCSYRRCSTRLYNGGKPFMSKITLFPIVLILPLLSLSTATPVAAQETTTCSGNRALCQRGVASRGAPDAQCRAAYAQCMKTGVWQTQGPGGRRVEGVVRK